MKKLLTMAVAFAMVASLTLGLTACGGGSGKDHTHAFKWVYNNDATCTEDGTETGTCACGETQTRTKTGTKLGHDIQPLPAKEATCSESGYSAHNGCTRCGYTTDNVTYADALHVQYELNERGDGYTVVSVDDDCDDPEIEIPYYYKGLPVTAIGEEAFHGTEGYWTNPTPDGDSYFVPGHLIDLESLVLPDSVKTIGKGAFNNLHSLESIALPNGVTEIGDSAFDQCHSLENIAIPENVTSIGELSFSRCASLKTVTFAENSKLTSIGLGAFRDCSSLESIVLPQSVNSIGEGAFNDCYSLKTCTIPEGVISIANGTFARCESLSNITLPESLTSIGSSAFSACGKLTKFTIPKNVTSIGELAFTACRNILEVWNFSALPIEKGAETFGGVALYAKYVYTTKEEGRQVLTDDGYLFFEDENENFLLFYFGNEISLTLPALSPKGKPYEIYFSAFSGCHSLESILLSEGVTSINNGAFANCDSLTSIMIPKSVTEIGYEVFWYCRSLEKIYYRGTEAEWNNITIDSTNDELTRATRYYFSEEEPTAEQWAESENWWHYDGTEKIVEWAK